MTPKEKIKRDDIRRNIALQCKAFRISKDISRKELSDELKIPISRIENFETGRTNDIILLNWYLERGLILKNG